MKIKDERILVEKRMINSKLFAYTYLILWIMIIHRQFILKQDIVEYLDVFTLTILLSILLVISNVKKGLYLTYRSKKRQKSNLIIGMIVGCIVFFFINHSMNKQSIAISLISSLIFCVCMLIGQFALLKYSNNKSNEDNED